MAPKDDVNGVRAVALQFNGIPVRDRGEMLSLTDMWRAAGSPAGQRPDDWKKDAANRAFLDHVAEIANTPVEGIWKGTRGAGGATFAHWHIALAYAKWLSPEFHAACNVIIRERMEGRHVVGLTGQEHALLERIDGISRMLAHKVTEIEKRVDERIDREIEHRLLADPRTRLLTHKPALEVLKEHKVPPRRRRSLSQRCSSKLLKFCQRHQFDFFESPETGRWHFHVNGIKAWLEIEGERLIAEHVAIVSGQGVLHLVPKAAS